MRHDLKRALPIIVAAVVVLSSATYIAARRTIPTQMTYYPQTGHSVRQPFLSFYQEAGGPEFYGYPLADAYTTEEDILVQPFQNAQLQITVRGIELTPIGLALQLGEPGNCPVSDQLAAFYEAHGGAAFFGSPLCSTHLENGLLIQDFERARLVSDAEGNVRLANLGTVYLAAFPPPSQDGQAAFHMHGTPGPPPAIRPSVSVEHPTVSQGDQQTIYLVVQDESGQAVAGTQALAILRYNNGVAEVTLPDTDERGFSSTAFITPPAAAGSRVFVELHVLVGETFLTIETTYLQWW